MNSHSTLLFARRAMALAVACLALSPHAADAANLTWTYRTRLVVEGTVTNSYANFINYDRSNNPIPVILASTEGDVVMPSVFGTLTIPRWIGNRAFAGCKKITSMTLADSIVSIGDYAFDNCKLLTSVKLPASLVKLGRDVFNSCSSLESLSLPPLLSDVNLSWYNGSTIRNITLEPGRTTFPPFMLACGASLRTVSLPDGLVEIPDGAFSGNGGMTSVNVPKSVVSIGAYAFRNCEKLSRVYIPASVTNIGEGAFCGCYSTVLNVDANNPVFSASGSTLYSKDGSTLLYMPHKETRCEIGREIAAIGPGAFAGNNITSLVFYGNAPAVTQDSFKGVASNAVVTITDTGSGFELDDDGCWYGMKVSVIFSPELRTASVSGVDLFYRILGSESVYIEGVADDAAGEVVVPRELNGVPVEAISEDAFRGRDKITRILLPEGLRYIFDDAFTGCTSLSDINIPGSVEIVKKAFENCPALCPGEDMIVVDGWLLSVRDPVPEKVVIPEGVLYTSVAFLANKPTLRSVTMPASLKVIGGVAFQHSTNLTEIVFKGNAPCDETAAEWFIYLKPIGGGTQRMAHMDWVQIRVPEGSTGWGVTIPGTWHGNPISYSVFDHAQAMLDDINPQTEQERRVAEAFSQLAERTKCSTNFSAWCAAKAGGGMGTLAARLAEAPQARFDYIFDLPLGTFQNEPKIEIGAFDLSNGITFRVTDGDVAKTIERLNASVLLYAADSIDGLQSGDNAVLPAFTVNVDGTVTLVPPQTGADSGFYRIALP